MNDIYMFLLALLSKYIERKTFDKTQKHKTLLQEQRKNNEYLL